MCHHVPTAVRLMVSYNVATHGVLYEVCMLAAPGRLVPACAASPGCHQAVSEVGKHVGYKRMQGLQDATAFGRRVASHTNDAACWQAMGRTFVDANLLKAESRKSPTHAQAPGTRCCAHTLYGVL